MGDVVVVEQARKRFGDLEALKGVSFTVPEKSIFGLIGPNGAGKTTLMSLILGYLDPTAGRVRVLGVGPREVHTLRGKVAALPQDAELPGAVSVQETLAFFGRLCGLQGPALNADVDRVLSLVDMRDWRQKKLRQLSHGMRKRIGIAQALLGSPEVVVLDEPTAGLDPKHAYELVELFRKIRATSTIIDQLAQPRRASRGCATTPSSWSKARSSARATWRRSAAPTSKCKSPSRRSPTPPRSRARSPTSTSRSTSRASP